MAEAVSSKERRKNECIVQMAYPA